MDLDMLEKNIIVNIAEDKKVELYYKLGTDKEPKNYKEHIKILDSIIMKIRESYYK